MMLFLREGRSDASLTPAAAMRAPEVFRRNSIRPPDMAALCGELKLRATLEPAEFTPEGVFEALGERRLRLSAEKCAALRAADRRCATAESAAEVAHASHSYGGIATALEDVNLAIRRGEIVAILGANGSGKTTLVQCIAGLLEPEEGAVRLQGEDLRRLDRERIARLVGYVFQNPDHQLFSSTVGEDVAFGPRNFGMPQGQIAPAVAEALRRVGLEGHEERDPFTLTRGERQRVAVASVLVSRPGLIILDEPTTGLDWTGQVGMMELVSDLRQAGCTIVLVTHSMWLAAAYADRVIVMRAGRIALDGPTRDVFSQQGRLAEASLRAPAITRLSAMCGQTLLSVGEFVRCIDFGP
jgi:energy-coupling factor transport system ATP-binding protein